MADKRREEERSRPEERERMPARELPAAYRDDANGDRRERGSSRERDRDLRDRDRDRCELLAENIIVIAHLFIC